MEELQQLAPRKSPSGRKYKQSLYLCVCGDTTVAIPSNVKYGITTSCGCQRNIKPRNIKAVVQLSHDQELNEFSSIKNAAKHIGVHPSTLSTALKKNWKCGGYQWRYKN